jgi:hypothetical protein
VLSLEDLLEVLEGKLAASSQQVEEERVNYSG